VHARRLTSGYPILYPHFYRCFTKFATSNTQKQLNVWFSHFIHYLMSKNDRCLVLSNLQYTIKIFYYIIYTSKLEVNLYIRSNVGITYMTDSYIWSFNHRSVLLFLRTSGALGSQKGPQAFT